MYLAGDVGGTKTHLALYEEKNGSFCKIRDEKFPSKEYKKLEVIVEHFLGGQKIQKACFGIAGPVENNVCHATNLPWIVMGDKLSQQLNGVPVFLINDLEANAHGIRVLDDTGFFVLNPGRGKGNQALISAGTGLGEAGLYFDGKEHHPFACEGGHCDFAPRNEMEIGLWRYLQEKYGHVSYERLVSGMGIYNIYSYLAGEERKIDPKEISEKAMSGSCPMCSKAIDWFISIYGSEAGNLALKTFAIGGIFIGGGIAPKVLEKMKGPLFMKSFVKKGRFQEILQGICVKVILDQETALKGASHFAHTH